MEDVSGIKECIGCGYCCWKVTCEFGKSRGAQYRPCSFLVFENGRHWCGLVLKGGETGKRAAKCIGIGVGCCSNLNSWRMEPIKDRRKD